VFIRELLAALAQARVDYCVVGGVAVNLHGVPRMTYDVDIVVAPTRATLSAVAALLDDFGLKPRQPIDFVALADARERQRLREESNLIAVTFGDPSDPLREVDVLVSPPIEAAEIIARATMMSFGGIAVRVVSIDDLIALKRASGRAQDEADVEHLERIRRGERGDDDA
jgi:hypothetical protein